MGLLALILCTHPSLRVLRRKPTVGFLVWFVVDEGCYTSDQSTVYQRSISDVSGFPSPGPLIQYILCPFYSVRIVVMTISSASLIVCDVFTHIIHNNLIPTKHL